MTTTSRSNEGSRCSATIAASRERAVTVQATHTKGASASFLSRNAQVSSAAFSTGARFPGSAGPVLRDPHVDALPPVIEPGELGLAVAGPGHLAGRHPP